MSLTPEIAPSHVNIRELEERWGITRNALKHRAKSLGVELLRPTTKSTFWPGEQLQNGEDLHQWISTGNELAMFPGVLMAQGANTTSLRVVRPKNPVTDDRDMSLLTTAMVSLVQNQQTTTKWDEIEAAAENSRPYTGPQMAKLLGRKRLEKSDDGLSPMPGYVLERIEHFGREGQKKPTPYWRLCRTLHQ